MAHEEQAMSWDDTSDSPFTSWPYLLSRQWRWSIVILFVASMGAGSLCQAADLPNSFRRELMSLDRLLRLMEQRLTLMHDVARWKWNAGQPIAAPERERELLRSVVEGGRGRGLDPNFVRSFFTAQIQAARFVEEADFERWKATKQKTFANTTGLPDLRRRIDELNRELIDALVGLSPALSGSTIQQALPRQAEKILDGNGLAAVRQTAIAPLLR
jgi:chorismate mutase-like protein